MPWTNEHDLITARQLLAASTCDAPSPGSGYRIYALGGADSTETPLNTAEVYDTSANNWSSVTATMSTARAQLAATSGPGRLYALGGFDGTSPLDSVEIYDPAANTWGAAPPMPTARAGLAAATGRDGIIYAIGGVNGTSTTPNYLATVEAFDPATNTWASKAPMPTPRFNLAAVVGPDGLIYAIGGQNSVSGTLDVVEVFNSATNSWTTGTPIPASRTGLGAAVGPDGLIYAIGGIDQLSVPQATVYAYDPATGGLWTTQTALNTAQSFLATDTGPDGLIYAIGGADPAIISTVEAFKVAAALTAPDPYIGNGTYQSPDIVLLDPVTLAPIPIGGAPGGAWDTLLVPNTNYPIQAVVYNDSNVDAPNTIVGFWQFPGGVGTTGTLIDKQTVTVPANNSILVASSLPFRSGAAGQHECVALSVANSASQYFNVDPATGPDVIDPTIPHPLGSGHFGSAWRNTNSVSMGMGMIWKFPFQASIVGKEPVPVKVLVTARKVAMGWERTGEAIELRKALEGAGMQSRLPVFLIPEVRSRLPLADLGIKVHLAEGHCKEVDSHRGREHHFKVKPGQGTPFTVSGSIPQNARPGDRFLVNVAAHYSAASPNREAAMEYLEVIYVK